MFCAAKKKNYIFLLLSKDYLLIVFIIGYPDGCPALFAYTGLMINRKATSVS